MCVCVSVCVCVCVCMCVCVSILTYSAGYEGLQLVFPRALQDVVHSLDVQLYGQGQVVLAHGRQQRPIMHQPVDLVVDADLLQRPQVSHVTVQVGAWGRGGENDIKATSLIKTF